MNDGNGALPEGWEPIDLADVINIRNGYAFKSKEFQKEGVPLVRQSNLAGDIVDLESAVCLPANYLQEYERFSLKQGDILIGMSGSIGKLCTYDKPQPSLQNQRTGKIEFLDESSELRGFLWFYLQTVQQRLEGKGKGIGVQNVSGRDITSLNLKLPPLAEQRRIVSKIESLQERSSRARRALSEVGPLLEQFRQSVLRAAFSGRLTADWRAAHPDVEPATELLARIRTERRHRWEQSELAKYEAKGKKPPKNWQDKYKEPQPLSEAELAQLTPLPDGWCWTTFETLTESFDHIRIPLKLADRDQRSGPYPYYGASGIIDDIDDFLFDGDFLLIGEDGANLLARSTPIAFLAHGKFWVNNHAHVSQTLAGVRLEYIEAFINGITLQPYVTGSAQPKLTQKNLNSIPVALAPIEEHEPMLEKIEASLETEKSMVGVLAESESALTQLDQSILAKAFRGELVPQDPRDEPASELLARIRQTREAAAATTSKSRGRSKRTARQASQPAAKSSPDEPHGGTEASREPVRGENAETQISVLTIKQPWADHIIFGNKWCENRNWTAQHRGPLYIHAGMSWDADGGDHTPGNGQHGAILGRVNLVDVLDLEELDVAEVRRIARKYGLSTASAAMQHVTGRYCWILTEPQALKQPIETPGKLKIWKFDAPQDSLAFHEDRMAAVTEPATSTVQAAVTEPAKPADRPAVADSPRPMDDYTRDELMAVIRDVFTSGGSRSRDQAIHDIADALSFARVGHRIREAIDNSIRTAVRRGILNREQGELSLLCRHIDEYTRDHLVDILLTAMGTGWWEQSEAIRTATGHLGYRRTGQNIQKAFKSTINTALRRNLLERNGQELRRIR